MNNTYLDNRIIRADWDMGFVEGRQYGRGFSGAQKRDEMAVIEDPDRPKDLKYIGNKKRPRDNNYREYRDNKEYGRDHQEKKSNYRKY